jgi:hypothetical protein
MTMPAGSASTMGEALKQCFDSLGGTQKRPAVSDWINHHYPGKWAANTLQHHLYGCCVNNPSGIKYHRSFPRFLYYRGGGEYELYDSSKHGVFDVSGYPEGQAPDTGYVAEEIREEIAEQIEERIGTEFAYEAHLRDYLARNLGLLESGMTLWNGSEGSSIEFQIGGRRVDIFAKDKDGVPVVIELKLSKGHERTIGQALYYRAKLKQLLSVSKVRIILVAAEMTDELRLAASEVQDVDLFQYALTMQLDRVKN